MRVMVVVKASQQSEAGAMPSPELLQAMGKFNEELVAAGVMQAGEGLKPSSEGVRVRFSGDERAIIDGPFTETRELIAGFWIWKVDSMQAAVDWLKRCPCPTEGEDAEVEIRPIFETEDFAEQDPTGEVRLAEQRMREELEGGS